MPDIALFIICCLISIVCLIVFLVTIDHYVSSLHQLWFLSYPVTITLWLWFMMYALSEPLIQSKEICRSVTVNNVDMIVNNGDILNLNEHFNRRFEEGSKISITNYKCMYMTKFGVYCTCCRAKLIEIVE